MSEQNNIAVTVGEYLFEFSSKTQWVTKGRSWFRNCGHRPENTICVDSHGRICRVGRQFMRAEQEGTFPIKVYAMTTDEPARNVIAAATEEPTQ